MTLQLVAAIPIGFERVVAKEIRSLGGGIGKTRSHAGRISFEGPDDAFYRCNLGLRTAERILVQVGEFSARTMSCLLYTSPSPRDRTRSRMPSSA